MSILIDGVEHWLFAGVRVTDLNDNAVIDATVTFTELGSGAGGASYTPRSASTQEVVSPLTTNAQGNIPRVYLPARFVDLSADGSTYYSLATIELADTLDQLDDAATAAAAAQVAAEAAQTAAENAEAAVEAGPVSSVNGQTGTVFLTPEDIGAATAEAVGQVEAVFAAGGDAAVQAYGMPFYNSRGRALTIRRVVAAVGTAPTGSDLVVEVNLGAGNVATVTIPDGQTRAEVADLTVAWAVDTALTVEVTAVGSTTPGADLIVQAIAD